MEKESLRDQFDRRIDYLRISLTDRCNLKCFYCMPGGDVRHFDGSEMLTAGEVVRFVRTAHQNGVSKVRLTGGEPLLRPDIVDLVREIKEVGTRDLGLTTNGTMLAEMAAPLKAAGLGRVNVSMDTLKDDRYRLMTRGGDLGRVWEGIEEAERAGLRPVKINVVPVRGVNDDEAVDFARLTLERDWHVRFIELMPVGRAGRWSNEACVKKDELIGRISVLGRLGLLKFRGKGPSRNYRIEGARGVIGFISPISECFCQWCNRLRLTAHGMLRPCLFSDIEVDVKTPMRKGATDEELSEIFSLAVRAKPERHRLREDGFSALASMSKIGG